MMINSLVSIGYTQQLLIERYTDVLFVIRICRDLFRIIMLFYWHGHDRVAKQRNQDELLLINLSTHTGNASISKGFPTFRLEAFT